MTKKRKTNIESALRRVWNYYDPARKRVIERCKVATGAYRCEVCGKLAKISVHHIVPIATIKKGADIPSVCSTLFVNENWLKGVCTECHKSLHKTIKGEKNEKKIRRRNK